MPFERLMAIHVGAGGLKSLIIMRIGSVDFWHLSWRVCHFKGSLFLLLDRTLGELRLSRSHILIANTLIALILIYL